MDVNFEQTSCGLLTFGESSMDFSLILRLWAAFKSLRQRNEQCVLKTTSGDIMGTGRFQWSRKLDTNNKHGSGTDRDRRKYISGNMD